MSPQIKDSDMIMQKRRIIASPQKINKSSSTSKQIPHATAYALFMHCEELRRRKVHFGRASMTKIRLTDELIAQTKQNINMCTFDDLQTMARQTLFKKNLQRRLHYRHIQIKAILKARKESKRQQQLEQQEQQQQQKMPENCVNSELKHIAEHAN